MVIKQIERAMKAVKETAQETLVSVELYWDSEVRQCTGREWRRVAAVEALRKLETQARLARERLEELSPRETGDARQLSL